MRHTIVGDYHGFINSLARGIYQLREIISVDSMDSQLRGKDKSIHIIRYKQ